MSRLAPSKPFANCLSQGNGRTKKAIPRPAVDEKVAQPRVADAKAVQPRVADAKAAQPRVADAKAAQPRVADAKAAQPRVADEMGIRSLDLAWNW
jgi:colicin import membrane protein